MTNATAPAAILLHPDDNVLVCCRPVATGEAISLSGETIIADAAIDTGHKLARRWLNAGDPIIKYGSPIGSATSTITPGAWIHLHNMKSDYIDPHTRAAQGDRL